MKGYGWLRTLFLVIFATGSAGAAGWHWFVVRPAKACEARAGWWDADARVCAQPFNLSDRTGRPLGQKRTPEQIAVGQARFRAATGQAAAAAVEAPSR